MVSWAKLLQPELAEPGSELEPPAELTAGEIDLQKKRRALAKKLKQIEELEAKQAEGHGLSEWIYGPPQEFLACSVSALHGCPVCPTVSFLAHILTVSFSRAATGQLEKLKKKSELVDELRAVDPTWSAETPT